MKNCKFNGGKFKMLKNVLYIFLTEVIDYRFD